MEQMSQYQEAFMLFDQNQDGVISAAEVSAVIHSLGYDLTEQEVRDIIKEADKDENGIIDFEEFKDVMAQELKETDYEEQFKEAFQVLDKNQDGFISSTELMQVMKNLGEAPTDEDIKEMIAEVDMDSDGQVNYEEFKTIMTS